MDGWMQAAGQLAQAGLPSLGSLIGGLAAGFVILFVLSIIASGYNH